MAWIPHRRHPERRRRRPALWSSWARVGTGALVAAAFLGILAYFSPGRAASSPASALSISAAPAPSLAHRLYPGATGDVALTIHNPNPYPMTITALQLPTTSTFANGYTTAALSHLKPGCLSSTPSRVVWTKSTTSRGSSHQLTSPVVVGAGGTVTVTITKAASMAVAAPAACEGTYFTMPSLVGVTAKPSPARPGASPVVVGLDSLSRRPPATAWSSIPA